MVQCAGKSNTWPNLLKSIMTDDAKTTQILKNEKDIKSLIKNIEGLRNKVKRMTEEIDSLRRENLRQKKEIKTMKNIISGLEE